MPAVFAGVVAGVFIFSALALTNHDPILGLNAGFIALCSNFLVVASVSLLTSPERGGFNDTQRPSTVA
jgi:hypothetical protein